MGDGSVHFISREIDEVTWQNLCDPRDEQIINSNW
jgi:hypothetical protein